MFCTIQTVIWFPEAASFHWLNCWYHASLWLHCTYINQNSSLENTHTVCVPRTVGCCACIITVGSLVSADCSKVSCYNGLNVSQKSHKDTWCWTASKTLHGWSCRLKIQSDAVNDGVNRWCHIYISSIQLTIGALQMKPPTVSVLKHAKKQ